MQNGAYRVKVNFYEGCEKLSSVFETAGNEKSLLLDKTIQIYPNPTDGNITIEIDNDFTGKIRMIITDNLGRTREDKNFYKNQKTVNYTEQLSDLDAGSYLIEFIIGKRKISKSLIIK